MSISSASLLKDGVIAVTGGTAKPFTSLGVDMSEHSVVFDGDTILSRSSALFKSKAPVKSDLAPSGYTQARNEVSLRVPFVVTVAGVSTTVYNTVNIRVSTDVQTTNAARATMLGLAAQILTDSDFTGYWDQQSLS